MSGIRRAPRQRLASALAFFLLVWPLTLGGAAAQTQHLVAPGDTLFGLARSYGTSVEALREANSLSGDLLRVGQALRLPAPPGFRMVASNGETLGQLADRLGIQAATLSLANPGLALGATIPSGFEVRVPPLDGVSRRIGQGQTLLELAIEHGVAPSALLQANGLDGLSSLRAGEWVLIPVSPTAYLVSDVATLIAPGDQRSSPPEPVAPVVTVLAMAGPAAVGSPDASPAPADSRQWHESVQLALLDAVPDMLGDFVPRSEALAMPLDGVLSSGFGWRDISVAGNRFHAGIDLAVHTGTPVTAAADGQVVRAGWIGAYGYAVYVDHGDDVETRYAHLSELWVNERDTVRQGDVLGRAGSTGASTGPHLHFEVRLAGHAVDPLTVMGR
jgi:murein DD-endopeptidase MepM/ murein hydrolase activator NlpD